VPPTSLRPSAAPPLDSEPEAERWGHGMGAIVAALLPLILLMPSLPSATPLLPAAWQAYLAWLDAPLHGALARIAWLIPIGSDGTRQSALALAMLCAACASVFVLLDVAIARATRAFELAPVLRAPAALALTWVLLAQALMLEPVIVRLGPIALIVAVVVGCGALRFRVSTERLIEVLERARGRAADERKPSRLALTVVGTFMALGALYLRGVAQSTSELRGDVSEALREALVYRAAPRSVLVMSDELTASSARTVLAVRPDIEVIDVSALFDVKGAEALASRRPELTALIRASLLRGELDAPELQAFAAQRPVRLALPLDMLASVREVLLPAGLLSEVATSSVTSGDLSLARTAGEDHITALLGELALGEVDAATRGWVRDQCVLTAALVAPLSRGAFLAEYLDRARLLTHDAADKKGLAAALATMGIPAAAAQ
jgi:hypothetical protein